MDETLPESIGVADGLARGEALAYAVRKLGGLTATARRLCDAGLVPDGRMSPQNVYNWVLRGHCPARYAPWIERETGVLREWLVADDLAWLVEGLCDCPEGRDG
jgi:hypothetical protein